MVEIFVNPSCDWEMILTVMSFFRLEETADCGRLAYMVDVLILVIAKGFSVFVINSIMAKSVKISFKVFHFRAL